MSIVRSRQLRVGAVGLVLVAVSACGTTVDLATARTSDSAGSFGLPAGTAAGGAGGGSGSVAGGQGGGTLGGAVSGGQGGAGGSAGVGGASGGSTGGAAGSARGQQTGGGSTATGKAVSGPLIIGYTTERDLSQTATTLGISGADPGNIDAEVSAAAKRINQAGGIDGRQVKPLDYDFDVAAYVNNPAEADQAACAFFTQDRHVGAVFDTAGLGVEGMISCLGKAGIPVVSEAFGEIMESAQDYAGNLFSPSLMSTDRYIPQVVAHLKAAGFFTGWNATTGKPQSGAAHVGIMHFNDPASSHYAALYVQALARIGIQVNPRDDVSYSESLSDESAETSNAVLKFRNDGVTEVLNANLYFYKDAENQGYHPRYGIDDAIATPALLASNVGASSLNGAVGAGYLPVDEVPGFTTPSPAATRCAAMMQQANIRPKDQFQRRYMLSVCDDFNLLDRLGSLARGNTTISALSAAAQSLGNSFVPAMTYSAGFTGRQHDGGQRVRTFAYQDSCSCFHFSQ